MSDDPDFLLVVIDRCPVGSDAEPRRSYTTGAEAWCDATGPVAVEIVLP